MAESRTRTRNRIELAGTIVEVSSGDVLGEYTVETIWQRNNDWWKKKARDDGTLPPSPLTIDTIVRPKIGLINGTTAGNTFALNAVPLSPNPPAITTSWAGEPSSAELIARLLANTNPFRYEVSAPIMISELIEAVSLLKVSVKTFASFFGSSYLNWKFGWEATMMDIAALADITKTIESRVREFNSLIKRGGIRRRVNLFSNSQTVRQPNELLMSTWSANIRGPTKRTQKVRIWGSVRWRPKRLDAIPTEKLEVFNLALRQVLDLEAPDPATIWEILPFSWAYDYFVNLGDVLKALEQSDLVEPYDICIMWYREMIFEGTPTSHAASAVLSMTGFVSKRTQKGRRTYGNQGVGELLRWGLLSEAQALTLTALIASRVKK